jgi:hypothetical protein
VERFSTGLVLSTGLRQLARTGLRFLPVVLIVHAPLLAYPQLLSWLALVVDVPLAAMVSHAVIQDLRGAPVTLGRSLAAGLARTPHALGTMFLVYLVSFALVIALGLPVLAGGDLETMAVIVLFYVTGLSAVLLALYSRWFVVIPAIVMERPGVVGALSRSGDLTGSRRLRITGVIVVVSTGYVAALFGLVLLAPDAVRRDAPWVIATGVALFALFGLVRAVMAASAYHLIRAETEAHSPEQLAKIFD